MPRPRKALQLADFFAIVKNVDVRSCEPGERCSAGVGGNEMHDHFFHVASKSEASCGFGNPLFSAFEARSTALAPREPDTCPTACIVIPLRQNATAHASLRNRLIPFISVLAA